MSTNRFPYFPGSARVWLFPAAQLLSDEQETELKNTLEAFIQAWKSHGKPVKGSFEIYGHCVAVVVADEDFESPSGCSIDSCVRVIREFAEKHGLNMFNRTGTYLLNDHSIQILTQQEVNQKVNDGSITGESKCVNLQVNTLEEFLHNFIQPFGNNWLGKKLIQTQKV